MKADRHLASTSFGAWIHHYRLPRFLHPGAWWIWALALAAAASQTSNPILLGLTIAVVTVVVVNRRAAAEWALAFKWYLLAGTIIVVLRVAFRILFAGSGPTVLFSLPTFGWFGGQISAEAILAGFYDGLRLATMIICVGAANVLANPKRVLAAIPSALYEVGTVLIVSLSVFPQLAESVLRVRRARALRGGPRRGRHALRGIVIPVLADALDRSLLLAAAMDSRGYGRQLQVPRRTRRLTSALLLTGVVGIGIGAYGLMDNSGEAPELVGAPLLLGGIVLGVIGFALSGRRIQRSRYRPDRWRSAELLVVASGMAAAVTMFVSAGLNPVVLHPSPYEGVWPQPVLLPVIGLLIAVLPSVLTPQPGDRPLRKGRVVK